MAHREARCRACGARVWFVVQPNGKEHPVNDEVFAVADVGRAPPGYVTEEFVTIVTRYGVTIRGRKVVPELVPNINRDEEVPEWMTLGGRSHFATCTDPTRFRVGKEKR